MLIANFSLVGAVELFVGGLVFGFGFAIAQRLIGAIR
jgi:hypothetical protein